jgi:3-hydroxybutyrate dehydrogenase
MLKDKWALVTGATAGLGLAVAESLAGAGANIVLHDLVEPAQTKIILRSQFRRRGGQHRGRPVAARRH